MSAIGLSVALRELGISDDSGLKLREAGLDDLDLIAAAFDNVQDFASWLEVQPAVPLKCFFERCQASAKASVLSCVAQVSLPTPEVSVPVDTSASALSSPVPVEFKLTGDGARQDVVPRTTRKRGLGRRGKTAWLIKKQAASPLKGSWKASLVDRLIEENTLLGTSAKDWAVVSSLSPHLLEQRVGLQKVRLSSFSSSTLSAALTALRRWKAWCVENVGSSVEPCAVHVALWLRSLDDQPTVPSITFAAIKWLETHMSFTFFVADPEVAHWRSLREGYEAAQVQPFTIIQWFELERAAIQAKKRDRLILGMWLLLLLGCLRFKHVQRSTPTFHGSYVAGTAAKGKTRVKAGRGVRRPSFSWSCPTLGVSGDLAEVFVELVSNAGVGFVLRDELGGKMRLGKFYVLSRKLFASLQDAPHLSSLTDCTSYMARRTLPTAADVLGLSSSDRAAVGGWAGKETAGTVVQAARRLRMPLRYSGIAATSALVVKAYII